MFELRLLSPPDVLEVLSEALFALDALSVSVEDADAQTDCEQALFGEPGLVVLPNGWQRSHVLALFAQQDAAQNALQILQAQDFFGACQWLGTEALPDQDWVRLTQSQFAPVQITPDFWIVPSWHQTPPTARLALKLDPGLAFGTGTHATTRMCLRWLARQEGSQVLSRVLDYGCGSGILAIAAARLGAGQVDAVDIDPAAVQASRDNAQANQVSLRVGAPELASGRYQTVLANILASPLQVLAPLLCALVAPGGQLVLAGILTRQVDALQAAYAPYCALTVADQEDGWVLMTASFL